MPQVNENTDEIELLGWFEDLGYEVVFGPELAPDGERPERKSYNMCCWKGGSVMPCTG
jgi:type I restriction enzyme R subunit